MMNPTTSDRILKYMRSKGYTIFSGNGELNIVAIEGMNLDGTLNSDEPDRFNDAIGVFSLSNNQPRWAGIWRCTTEPGWHFTLSPMNARGAARIQFGQYRAWQVGVHNGDHEALIQTGGEVTVRRDGNQDMMRPGDPADKGWFGINIHHGWNARTSIGRTSAGCTVIPVVTEFEQFMRIVKSDVRYRSNRNFIYSVAYLPGNEIK